LIGAALAWSATRRLHAGLLLAMLVASVLIQAATNMFNEYFDYVKGLDTADSVGIAGAITQDGVHPRTVLYCAIALFVLATLLGVYICAASSWWLAAIGAGCMLVGYLYTGGPYPIAATPFGELFAGGFMGGGIVLISCFIQQGFVTPRDVAASVPNAILIAAILTANNIRDRVGDQESGRRTLAILLGHRRAVWLLALSLAAANLWTAGLAALGVLPPWTLLALASLWPARAAIRIYVAGGPPARMMPGMQRVAQTNTVFGLLLALGILLG
jgi:1,4-dihydroxy-2-naphthoate octaprenyltransferase